MKRLLPLALLLSATACSTIQGSQDSKAMGADFSSSDAGDWLVDDDPVASRDANFKPIEARIDPFPWVDLTVDETPVASRGIAEIEPRENTGPSLSNDIVDPEPAAIRAK